MMVSLLEDVLQEEKIISTLMQMAMQNHVYLFIIRGQISELTACLRY